MKIEPFANIFQDSTSKYNKIKKEDYKPDGLFPIIDQGQTFIGGYTNDENLIVKSKHPIILFGDHTKIFKYIDFPFTIGADGVKVLTLKNNNYNALYFYFYLKSISIVDKGYSRHFKYLKEKKLPVPENISSQIQIANILSKAETLIEQRKQSIVLLDEFLKSTFLEMFGDPVLNEKDWKTKPLVELCLIRRGASPRPINNFIGKDVPWIKIGDGTKGNELYIESTKVSITNSGAEKSVMLNEGSLVFANCGVSLGFARILKIKGCIHDGWLSFEQVSSELDKIFLLKLLNHSTNYLRRIAPDGTQPNLNIGIMKKFEIILPPVELQVHFANIVSKTETLREQYKSSLVELENLYGSLSQRAFKGELEMKVQTL